VRLRGEGGEARAARLDVADRAAFKPLFDDHVAAFGGLDIAFANAGVDPGPGSGTRPATAIPTARSTPSIPNAGTGRSRSI
jgi:NAD(P)-dependent dehydrogenase (short-subunit alcohol dehydrogenase family)